MTILLILIVLVVFIEIKNSYYDEYTWDEIFTKIKNRLSVIFNWIKGPSQTEKENRVFRSALRLPPRRIRDAHFFSNEDAVAGLPPMEGKTGGATAVNRDTFEVWAWNKFIMEWEAETDQAVLNFMLGASSIFEGNVIYVKPHGSAAVNQSTGNTYDFDNLQGAIDTALALGKRVEIYGKTYYINKGLLAPKYWHFDIRGPRGAKIKATNGNSFAMVGRPAPNDSGDANVMIQFVWRVEDIELEGVDQIQEGLRPGPTYGNGEGSYLFRTTGKNLARVFNLEFCLNAVIWAPASVDCRELGILQSAAGLYVGATNTNSQCNNSTIYQPRYYGNQALMRAIREEFPNYRDELKEQYREREVTKSVIIKDVHGEILAFADKWMKEKADKGEISISDRVMDGQAAIRIHDSSSCTIVKPIIEGFSVDKGIEIISDTTVVKDCLIQGGYHFECVNGSSTAALYVRLLGGKVKLEEYFGQYPSVVADVGATGGYLEFEMTDMQWAVPINGKLINNNGCTYVINYCSYNSGSIRNSNFANLVSGIPVSLCGGEACGSNKFRVTDTPR